MTLGNFYGAEAESYGHLGEFEMAERKFKYLAGRYPIYAWGYINWADGYWLFPFDKAAPKDYQGLQRKIGRNEPCPCGSGRKYKRYCGLRR